MQTQEFREFDENIEYLVKHFINNEIPISFFPYFRSDDKISGIMISNYDFDREKWLITTVFHDGENFDVFEYCSEKVDKFLDSGAIISLGNSYRDNLRKFDYCFRHQDQRWVIRGDIQ